MSMSIELACKVCYQGFDINNRRPYIGTCGHSQCHTCTLMDQERKCPFCRMPDAFRITCINYELMHYVELRMAYFANNPNMNPDDNAKKNLDTHEKKNSVKKAKKNPGGNGRNNPGTNTRKNQGTNTTKNPEGSPKINPGTNIRKNPEANTRNNQRENERKKPEANTRKNQGTNTTKNQEGSPKINPGTNTRKNPEANARKNQGENGRNNPGTNTRKNPEANTRNKQGENERKKPEANTRKNQGTNTTKNPEGSPQINPGTNIRKNPEANPRKNPGTNRRKYPEANTTKNPEPNSRKNQGTNTTKNPEANAKMIPKEEPKPETHFQSNSLIVIDRYDEYLQARSFDKISKNLVDVEQIATHNLKSGFLKVHDSLYIIGGRNFQKGMATFEIYNFKDKSRKFLRSLREGRYKFGVCYHLNQIYVCGGQNEKGYLNSVETYSIENNKWTYFANLNQPRVSAIALSFNNDLYVIGGLIDGKQVDTVERYNKSLRRFEIIGTIPTDQKFFDGCQIDNRIFLGGSNDDQPNSKVWSYNPSNNEWNLENSFTSAKKSCKFYYHNSDVFAHNFICLEKYDWIENKWSVLWRKQSEHSLNNGQQAVMRQRNVEVQYCKADNSRNNGQQDVIRQRNVEVQNRAAPYSKNHQTGIVTVHPRKIHTWNREANNQISEIDPQHLFVLKIVGCIVMLVLALSMFVNDKKDQQKRGY